MFTPNQLQVLFNEAKESGGTHLVTGIRLNDNCPASVRVPQNVREQPQWDSVEGMIAYLVVLGYKDFIVYDLSKPLPKGIPDMLWT